MKISIQIGNHKSWDETEPVLHEIEKMSEADVIAYAISKQFGRVTVRMVYLPDNYEQIMKDLKSPSLSVYVCTISGAYIQSN